MTFVLELELTITVFHLTLTRLPMASGPYRRVSDFQKYSPSLASAKVERKRKNLKKKFIIFQKDLMQIIFILDLSDVEH